MTQFATLLLAALLLAASSAHASPPIGIGWTKQGTPGSAARIAGCKDGMIFALNADKTLWRNTWFGTDGNWTKIGTMSGAQDIGCADVLIAFNTDRSLWKNTGTETAPVWTRLGVPTGAKQVSYGWGYRGVSPAFFALNTDNSLWASTTGKDGTWSKLGTPTNPVRISAGRTGIWMIDSNHDIYRSFDGLNGHWQKFNHAGSADQIADYGALASGTLLALNTDKTLWMGRVTSAPNNIEYQGGLVLPGTQTVHVIWYGTWNATERATARDLLSHLSGSSYFNINTTYDDQIGNIATSNVVLGKEFTNSSTAALASEGDIQSVIYGAVDGTKLPFSNGSNMYLLMTGRDVTYPDFCNGQLGHHSMAAIRMNATTSIGTPYAIVGNNATQCPNGGWGNQGPNGYMDDVATIIAHELTETVTDPGFSGLAWYNPAPANTAYGAYGESGDMCAWDHGTVNTDSAGKIWNLTFGTHRYLLQTIFANLNGGTCLLSH